MAQDIRNLNRVVDLHCSVDSGATVFLKLLAHFLARSEENWGIVCSGRQYEQMPR